jgi:hypothetical protein
MELKCYRCSEWPCVCAGGVRVARPLFQEGGSGSIPTSALDFWFGKIESEPAKAMNKLWHSRFPECSNSCCRVCYGAEFEGSYYAVAIWTNPTSPKLPQLTWLMLSRWAIAPEAPKNTGTRMESWMVRDIRRRFPDVTTLVSYSDPDTHDGSIYRACNWVEGETTDRKTEGRKNWHNRERARVTKNTAPERVTRWTKTIRGDAA